MYILFIYLYIFIYIYIYTYIHTYIFIYSHICRPRTSASGTWHRMYVYVSSGSSRAWIYMSAYTHTSGAWYRMYAYIQTYIQHPVPGTGTGMHPAAHPKSVRRLSDSCHRICYMCCMYTACGCWSGAQCARGRRAGKKVRPCTGLRRTGFRRTPAAAQSLTPACVGMRERAWGA